MNKDITIRVNGKNNPSVSTKNLKELTAKVDSLEQDLGLTNKRLDENWANPMGASWLVPTHMGHVKLEPNVNGFVEHDSPFEGFVDIPENELEEYYDIDYWNDTDFYFHFNRTTKKFVLYGKDKTDNQFKFYKDWYWYDSEETGIRTHGGHWVEAEHINWIPDEYVNIDPTRSYIYWNATTRHNDTYNWDVALGDFVLVKNVLTQEMITFNDTIYHIQYDFDLDGKTITIPENCILEFDGGSLSNGALVGNGTYIETSSLNIFNNITIGTNDGQFTNDAVVVDWFAEVSDADKIQAAFQFMQYNRSAVKFLNRTYYLDKTVISHANQVTLLGTSNGGEFGRTGCVITASENFDSEYEGNPLFYLNPLNSNGELNYNSVRIDGINIENAPNNDGIQFLSAGGPSRPFFVEHCSFIKLNKAINVLDNGRSTEIANFVVERNTFQQNSWNIFARGRHSIMQFVFNNNVAEQCSGCINMGYTDEHSASGAQEPVPTTNSDFGYVCTNNIVITNNLLEGTVDTIYINGGPLYITITGNYFERGTIGYRQFIRLATSVPSSLRFYNNYESKSGTIGLYIDSTLFNYTEIRGILMGSVVASKDTKVGTGLEPLVKTQGIVDTITKVPIGLDTSIDGCDILHPSSGNFPYSDGHNRYKLFQNDGETDTTLSNISINRGVKAGDVLVLLSSVIIDDIYMLMNSRAYREDIQLGIRIRKLDNTYTNYVLTQAVNRYNPVCLEYCSKYVVPEDGTLINFYIKGKAIGHPYSFRVKYFDVIHIPAEKVAADLLYNLAFYQEDKIIADNKTHLPTECPNGTRCYVTNIGTYLIKNGDKWYSEDGYPYAAKQGASNNRPTEFMDNSTSGFKYFDTTLNKPIYWDGTKWVDEKGYTALPSTSTLDTLRTTHAESGANDVGMTVFLSDVEKPAYLAKYWNIGSDWYHKWVYMDGTVALDESVAPVNS